MRQPMAMEALESLLAGGRPANFEAASFQRKAYDFENVRIVVYHQDPEQGVRAESVDSQGRILSRRDWQTWAGGFSGSRRSGAMRSLWREFYLAGTSASTAQRTKPAGET